MMYIGIDNGVSGGIVAISAAHGKIIGMTAMPIQKARKGNQVNIRALHLWFTEVTGGNLSNAIYVIEEPGGSKSAKAAVSMAASFHSIRGFFETKFLRWEPVTPQRWQKTMLPGIKAGDTKPAALTAAGRIWPEEDWLATPRSRTPHDGLIDAALIAEYGRRMGI